MRIWHTGLPLLNGQDRESFIFTYSAPPPVAGRDDPDEWPTGTYGGPATVSGFNKNMHECGKELANMGRLDTVVREQLLSVKLTHSDAVA